MIHTLSLLLPAKTEQYQTKAFTLFFLPFYFPCPIMHAYSSLYFIPFPNGYASLRKPSSVKCIFSLFPLFTSSFYFYFLVCPLLRLVNYQSNRVWFSFFFSVTTIAWIVDIYAIWQLLIQVKILMYFFSLPRRLNTFPLKKLSKTFNKWDEHVSCPIKCVMSNGL